MSDLPPALNQALLESFTPEERLNHYQQILKMGEKKIRDEVTPKNLGLETSRKRSDLLDFILVNLFESAVNTHGSDSRKSPIALLANGGYGRQALNPGSDLDLLFLLPRASNKLPDHLSSLIEDLIPFLWDLGFKVGHSTRSIPECLKEAQLDPSTHTSLFDGRFLAGDKELFEKFATSFRKEAIEKDLQSFHDDRLKDIRNRYRRYSYTVFLQEPNIKESPGGLRDFHNLMWITNAHFGSIDITLLHKKGIISENALTELLEAHDFLHRVRNALHYHTGKSSDLLTLRLQGEIVDALGYKGKQVIPKTEDFMRDYYRHTRNIYWHTTSVFQNFALEIDEPSKLTRFIPFLKKKEDLFDGFIERDGLIFAQDDDLFEKDPPALMRLFRHTQARSLKLSPPMRKAIKGQWKNMGRTFRYLKDNREVFQSILEKKGSVARILRQMHRVNVLGRFLPEFGQLDCLVQHEFFHRYTADEHTLRTIDELDALLDNDQYGQDSSRDLYRKLFIDFADPYALYIALILHDTGRAENAKYHSDASAQLASNVCRRLQIKGERQRLILFLVDHHLTLWNFANKRNTSDPKVIAEFAGIIKSPERLDALLLFTYADSSGTSDESWTSWKESILLQLYRSTHQYLAEGNKEFESATILRIKELRELVTKKLSKKYHSIINEHFTSLPQRYFLNRRAKHIATHIRAIWEYIDRRKRRPDTPFECAIQWIEEPQRGHSEFILVTSDQPLLLEKVTCALAAHDVNILAADIFTRADGIIIDVFRICTTDLKAITDTATQYTVIATLYQLCAQEDYNVADYIKPKRNFLDDADNSDLVEQVPARAIINNFLDEHSTAIEISAHDSVGLLHSIVSLLHKHQLTVLTARISTERGAALDTIYVQTAEGKKLESNDFLDNLQKELDDLLKS